MQIYKKARQLVHQGYSIFIRYIKGHNRVEENKRADKARKKAAQSEKI